MFDASLYRRGFLHWVAERRGYQGETHKNYGGDHNVHVINQVDHSDHSVHAGVNNNQMHGRDLPHSVALDALKALDDDPITAGFFSDDDLNDLMNAASGNPANDTHTVIIDHSTHNYVNHANNKGFIINGKKFDVGSGKLAEDVRTWPFRRRQSVESPLRKRVKYLDYSSLLKPAQRKPAPRPAPKAAPKPAAHVNKKVYDASTHNKVSMVSLHLHQASSLQTFCSSESRSFPEQQSRRDQ